ncbi:MAG TPA: hypothetical protein VJQ54_16785 [Candidatus Sulfotelmatobacter sp.]|nr:hypothetical protein [Candidatus Sulfotelmatobacter sp.]
MTSAAQLARRQEVADKVARVFQKYTERSSTSASVRARQTCEF